MKKNTFRNPIEPSPAYARKKVDIYLSNEIYIETDETHVDWDGDEWASFPNDDADFEQAYRESGLTVVDLLNELGTIAGQRIRELEQDCKNLDIPLVQRREKWKKLQHWRAIAENCKGWVIEEIEIE